MKIDGDRFHTPEHLNPHFKSEVRFALGQRIVTIEAADYTNSWVEYGTPYRTVRAVKNGLRTGGEVLLEGAVKSGTAGAAIFTLPAGMRPAATVRINSIEVSSAGVVTPDASLGNTLVPLDGIRFRTE